MVLNIKNNWFIFLSILIISCTKNTNNGNHFETAPLNKEERLSLFLELPLDINASTDEQIINNIKFHKSYILSKNHHFNDLGDSIIRATSDSYVLIDAPHSYEERDSLIRIASNNDVVEILKNKYIERIVYMRINTTGIKLNHGIYLGMSMDSFSAVMPLKINENHLASYNDEEFIEVNFIFDEESRALKEFNYIALID